MKKRKPQTYCSCGHAKSQHFGVGGVFIWQDGCRRCYECAKFESSNLNYLKKRYEALQKDKKKGKNKK